METYRSSVQVPDQNGCLEIPAGQGGTLAVSSAEEDCPHGIFPPDRYGLRVGVAKTKGKFRVVTMQSAYVKRVLRPVHECLYDFLSSRKWLVRGDVGKEHVRRVLDGRVDGEDLISGDYTAATDNIYLQVTEAISEVLASSPYLLPEEAEALRRSFKAEDMHWVSKKGISHPIRRGSMQGNLLSFPMLCLINKACYDLACSLRRRRTGKLRLEVPIINGDDIAFAGDTLFYDEWVAVTSAFGLVVNREKTGVSSVFVELNSRSFLLGPTGKIRAVRKPVLSCLMEDDSPSCLLSRLIEGLGLLPPGVLHRVIYSLRAAITLRGICVATVPSRFRSVLIKKGWFRRALRADPEIEEEGVRRHWRVIPSDHGPPSALFPLYNHLSDAAQREGISLARGFRCVPYATRLKVGPDEGRLRPVRLGFSEPQWEWRWREPVLRFWQRAGFPLVKLGSQTWSDDHPDLSVRIRVIILPGVFPPPVGWLRDQGVDESGHLNKLG
jgi:hypothetical protein